MLRASSEIAVATRVESISEKPNERASVRPFCRAATMSLSVWMGTRIVWFTVGQSLCTAFEFLVQVMQPFFQVQGGHHPLEGYAQLDHGEGHFRLDPNDDCLGPTQADHLCDFTKGPRGKGCHDVHTRPIDEHTKRTRYESTLNPDPSEMVQILVRERRLHS